MKPPCRCMPRMDASRWPGRLLQAGMLMGIRSLALSGVMAQCNAILSLGNDITLCEGSSAVLDAGPGYLSYLWSTGATGQTTTVTEPGTYSIQAQAFGTGVNMVLNGDFSQGMTGFSSGYVPGWGGQWGPLSNEGTYRVGGNPQGLHSGFQPCGDHTSGTGNMLVVNGASAVGINVWCQTVNLTPNTEYAFSAWLTSVHPQNPAVLQFTINGVPVGNPLQAAPGTCNWNQFYSAWNSGPATTATLCITNQNTSLSGNDFALDDISFTPFCTYTDTVTVVSTPYPNPDLGADIATCQGTPLILDVTTVAASYSWQNGHTGPVLTVTESGAHWVDVSVNGCTSRDSVLVTFLPTPQIDLGADIVSCADEAVLLNAFVPGAAYLWQDGSTQPTKTVSTTGTYWVEVDLQGCMSRDTIMVTFSPIPIFTLGNDTSLCSNASYLLDASTPGATYVWHNGATGPAFPVTTTGIHWVDVTVNGCTERDSAVVNILPSPMADLGPEVLACEGEAVLLNVFQPGANYQWQNGSTMPEQMVTASGTYWVRVDLEGCTASDTVAITFLPLPVVNLGRDTTICSNAPLLLVVNAPAATYLWQNGSTGSSQTIQSAGLFWVEVSINECSARDSVWVDAVDPPVVELGMDTLLCEGERLRVHAEGPGYNYLWHDGSTAASFWVEQAGTYSALVYNACGEAYDEISVAYDPCVCPVFVPNAFTPDGDGSNDAFKPIIDCAMTSYLLLVFDRWGGLVFETEDAAKAWDGTHVFDGFVPDGVYVWMLRLQSAMLNDRGLREYRGHVVLLR